MAAIPAATEVEGFPAESAESGPASARLVGPVGIILLTTYLVAFALLLLYSLVQLWPSPTPAGGSAFQPATVDFFLWTVPITDEVRLLLIVALTGALGALVHALRSISWYVGNRALVRSWAANYILLPFVGGTLALVFYLVIRGGFFSPQSTFQQTSPFGFAAMAGLIGMFSPQAVLKLQQVAETVLTKPAPGADSKPQRAEPWSPATELEVGTPRLPNARSQRVADNDSAVTNP
jgi:hypothetical protein